MVPGMEEWEKRGTQQKVQSSSRSSCVTFGPAGSSACAERRSTAKPGSAPSLLSQDRVHRQRWERSWCKQGRAEVGRAGFWTASQEGSAKKPEGTCQGLMLGELIRNRKQKKENKHLNKHDYYCIVQNKFELGLGLSCGLIGADKS